MLLRDRGKKRMLEADFTQYYNRNLLELWNPKSSMDLRWVLVHALQLPEYSRTMMAGRDDTLSQDQHLYVDIIDALNMLVYLNQIAVASRLGRADFSKAMSGAPKPLRRKTEKPEFVRGRDLAGVLGQTFSSIK